ncbi:hypothetical protein ACFPFV_08355 [Salinicoccus siamensis]|uniref:Uncharacterized protein n=1 Tax=Salinicoccus siamensis TaxID=381830 RepID=A0ABV5Z2F2_9STAP
MEILMEILTELFGAPGIAGAMGAIVIFFINLKFAYISIFQKHKNTF